ncbi:MAG TPA: acetylornithine transaminase [Bacilli bacterium]|nr:acetylornithine transaminase [Bacilli bacterium]
MSALFPTYARWDIVAKEGHGTTLIDANGTEYLDFTSGIGVCNLGHGHPTVVEALKQQADTLWHVSNLFQIPIQEEVATLLTEHSCGDYVFFCNSGAEANEAAIKLARKHTGKKKIITFKQSFHGRTLATLAATGQEKVQIGFGPLLEQFVYATYDDIDSVSELIDDETAAIMLEVIQGEGGVHLGSQSFFEGITKLCEEHGLLLIIDEVQTGIGRTGKPFAYQHVGLSPDIISSAKGLGNGFPVGAVIGKAALKETFSAGSHGSTFGGNPLAMAAAKATLEKVFDETLLADVVEKGEYLKASLIEALGDNPIVKSIRGLGLMVGIECDKEVAPFVKALQEKQLLILNAGPNVLRLLPPLIVTKEEIDIAVAKIAEVLKG